MIILIIIVWFQFSLAQIYFFSKWMITILQYMEVLKWIVISVVSGNGVESGGIHQVVAATQTIPDSKKPAPTPAPSPAPKSKKQSRYQLQQRLQAAAVPTSSPSHFQLDTNTSRKKPYDNPLIMLLVLWSIWISKICGNNFAFIEGTFQWRHPK